MSIFAKYKGQQAGGGGGTAITTPGTTVVGDAVTWGNTTGSSLLDAGAAPALITGAQFTGPISVPGTSSPGFYNNVAQYYFGNDTGTGLLNDLSSVSSSAGITSSWSASATSLVVSAIPVGAFVGQIVNATSGLSASTVITSINTGTLTIGISPAATGSSGGTQTLSFGYPDVIMTVSGQQMMRWQNPLVSPSTNQYGLISTLVNAVYPDSSLFSGGAGYTGASLGIPAGSGIVPGLPYGANRQYGHAFIDRIAMGNLAVNQSDNNFMAISFDGGIGAYGIVVDQTSQTTGGGRSMEFASYGGGLLHLTCVTDGVSGSPPTPGKTLVYPGPVNGTVGSNTYAAANLLITGGTNAQNGGSLNSGDVYIQPGYNSAPGGPGTIGFKNASGVSVLTASTAAYPSFPGGLVSSGAVLYGNYHMEPLEHSAGNSSTALTLDLSTGSAQFVTMTGNCTFTLTNPQVGGVYVLRLLQDATGSRTATWPASVKWSGGTAPTLTTTAAKTDLINLYWNGTNYFGNYTLNY